jgi:hypothetical protein
MGTRVIVSTSEKACRTSPYIVIDSVKEYDFTNVEYLIFNSCKDEDFVVFQSLARLKDSDKKIYYVTESINALYHMLFSGLSADIINEGFIIEEIDSLNLICDAYKEHGLTLTEPFKDSETIIKFIEDAINMDVEELRKLITNDVWKESIRNSVKNVNTNLVRSSRANLAMVDVLTSFLEYTDNIQENNVRLAEEITNVKNMIRELEDNSKPHSSLIQYPTYTVPVKIQKVCYVREYSKCMYLLSFFSAYQHYLKINKSVSAKILLIMPKNKNNAAKYNGITKLASDNLSIIDFSADTFMTFEPKKSVLDKFFGTGCDLYIVLESLGNDKILNGNRVEELGAVNSYSDVKTFGLQLDKVINSGFVTSNTEYTIPYIKDYVKTPEIGRKSMYADKCKELYMRFDNLLLANMRR